MDSQAAHVYDMEQHVKQIEQEYESAVRAQELKVIDKLSEERAKGQSHSREDIEKALQEEHSILLDEKDALENAIRCCIYNGFFALQRQKLLGMKNTLCAIAWPLRLCMGKRREPLSQGSTSRGKSCGRAILFWWLISVRDSRGAQ